MKQALIVFATELSDALRDRRTLLRVALPGLLVGPLMLFFLSTMVAQFESRAEKRELQVQGIAHGPATASSGATGGRAPLALPPPLVKNTTEAERAPSRLY